MDIDYHFSTVYVLARWAGFGSENANIIATSSEFVDDNISDDPKLWSTASKTTIDGVIRYSGHDLWENLFNEDGNEQVWVPYHFLPALQGETEEEKLICHKDSDTAHELRQRMEALDTSNPNYVFALGIDAHILADTWAHQEFAGVTSLANIVKDLVVEIMDSLGKSKWQSLEEAEDMLKSLAMDMAAPLGHAGAIHWPDRPYAKWKSNMKFPEGRDNTVEFMEASEALYAIFAKLQGKAGEDLQLDSMQKQMLLAAFTEITSDDPIERNAEWLRRISVNEFGFDDYNEADEHIQYNMYYLSADPDFSKAFYQALDDHYNWIKGKLEGVNVHRLQ